MFFTTLALYVVPFKGVNFANVDTEISHQPQCPSLKASTEALLHNLSQEENPTMISRSPTPSSTHRTASSSKNDDLAYTEGLQNSSGFLNTFFDAIHGSYCTYSAYRETVSN